MTEAVWRLSCTLTADVVVLSAAGGDVTPAEPCPVPTNSWLQPRKIDLELPWLQLNTLHLLDSLLLLEYKT